MKILQVPTGHIITMKGEKGNQLEFLSLGDYGKSQNIKADFLGFTDEINGVPHGELLPLSEKWVITISTQYGCSMDCLFCDVPKVGKGYNVTEDDLFNQVLTARQLHPEIMDGRINLHYARMGEPTFNFNIFNATDRIKDQLGDSFRFHPVISTMMPRMNKRLSAFLALWLRWKNVNGAGLQISINSTDEKARDLMFSGNALSLEEISRILNTAISGQLSGRKIALNFALTGDEINADRLASLFDPQYFMCKITPMHITSASKQNNIGNDDGYYSFTPYQECEKNLKRVGFDVIVFVPSVEEDQSRITCGNAILSDSTDGI
jgi:23S rRNA (adenine2503-C2)-methyltransferase